MLPFTQAVHSLHSHGSLVLIVVAAVAAAVVALWIACSNAKENSPGPRPPNDRRHRR